MSSPKPGAVLFARSLERLATFYERTLAMPVARAAHDHVYPEGNVFQVRQAVP